MQTFKLAARLLSGAAVLAMAACASTPEAPTASPPPPPAPSPEPAPAPPPTKEVYPIEMDRGAGAYPDDLEDYYESLPPTGAGAPEIAASRTSFREASRSGKPVQDYLPYIDVAIEQDVLVSGMGPSLQDRYTRIQIVTLDPDSYDVAGVAGDGRKSKKETRDYERESRGWLQRTMLGSRNVTRTLIADFDISNPDIKTTKALFSSTFRSDNAKGEAWATNESISVYATPYFKVSPNTTIEGKFRMQLSDERSSSAGANVMNALQTAANLIAPTSALVTFFNAPAMLQASTFLNTQSNSLFGQSITEESTGAFAIKSWTSEPILVIRAELPPAGNIKNTKKKEGIGKWVVYLDPPISSVFTSNTAGGPAGAPDFEGVSAADILSFNVGEDLRVYDYIFSRLELGDRITTLNETGDTDTARLICTRISRGLSEIGFTTYDAAAGVWAASESDQFSAAARTVLQAPETCGAMALWSNMTY
ncbi:MAG: hypothetical protein FP825_11695 [Hyphomonas sp.]|uniref:hypothetical protein n=1 Tax=Hyphomonas sp. TaxID=87 RepID=UPI0017E259D4|nr:hypothetical protein [Hyphomonas sp.]MBA3069132.1 hypothetical protein [Hyphomonas sp.]MBU4061547.1 hypothetical protein [Alphaproteobacteria bacterium]MBU4165405.1 hypothetical protein [Alphaproteobacteria bacterium]